jgi:hypothetical protein
MFYLSVHRHASSESFAFYDQLASASILMRACIICHQIYNRQWIAGG